MPGRRHDSVVEWLRESDPSVRTTGFVASVKRMLESEFGIDVGTQLSWLSVIPDAYVIDRDLVIAYEVEDSHRVSYAKMMMYARLWNGFRMITEDENSPEFRLIIMDIRGGVLEPDLASWWYCG